MDVWDFLPYGAVALVAIAFMAGAAWLDGRSS
jgi:hypothetical protein